MTTLFSSGVGDVNFPWLAPGGLVGAQAYNTNAGTSAIVLTGANISGGELLTVLGLTGAITAATNAQLPTVANLIAALGNAPNGQTYQLRVINVGGTSSGVFTLTTNTGWTLNGTMSIAVGAFRDFLVTVNTVAGTATLQSIGTGTNS